MKSHLLDLEERIRDQRVPGRRWEDVFVHIIARLRDLWRRVATLHRVTGHGGHPRRASHLTSAASLTSSFTSSDSRSTFWSSILGSVTSFNADGHIAQNPAARRQLSRSGGRSSGVPAQHRQGVRDGDGDGAHLLLGELLHDSSLREALGASPERLQTVYLTCCALTERLLPRLGCRVDSVRI